jgi:uncharacterized BrkB/YihY/UPF0761 family membrane protein
VDGAGAQSRARATGAGPARATGGVGMANPKKRLQGVMGAIDAWQRRHRAPAVAYGVARKFGDDNANLLVVALGWYGFTAIYPLLLVVITVFGYVGAASLGTGIVHTLHQFPVVGSDFNPGQGGSELHGSVFGLIIGVVGLLYGAQGVTQTAQQAMARVWNVPQDRLPGFLPRLGRSLGGLAAIGGAFLINAILAPVATGHGIPWYARILILAGMLVVNSGFYLVAFFVLTPASEVSWRQLLPGSVAGAVGFTLLITVGAGLVQHQLKHSSATYGQFAAVIGLVAFLLLLAKLTLYSAELNPVLARRLWPRALPSRPPTPADDEYLRGLAHEQRRRSDRRIGVGFDPDAQAEVEEDAGEEDAGEAGGDEPGGGEAGGGEEDAGDQHAGGDDGRSGAAMSRPRR